MSVVLRPAVPEDAFTIATIWVTAFDTPADQINKTKYGTANRDELIAFLAIAVRKEIETLPDSPYLVVTDENNEIISYAQWQFPETEDSSKESHTISAEIDQSGNVEKKDEKMVGGVYNNGPDGMNFAFFPVYYELGEKLLEDTVKGRPHFKLCNLATHPKHERRGAASKLLRWALDKADSQQVICYLDTNIDGVGKAFYEKMGFRRVGRCEFDLEKYGGNGKDSLISMVREPRGLS